MPPATVTIARDEILGRLKSALDASSYAGITVVYEDSRDDPPSNEPLTPAVPPGKPWIRAGVRHSDGTQSSLGSVNGKRRQTIDGVVFAQVFTPYGDGQTVSDEIVEVVLDAYRTGGATASGVQFRSARFAEVGKSGAWWQVNVTSDFTYDQIR